MSTATPTATTCALRRHRRHRYDQQPPVLGPGHRALGQGGLAEIRYPPARTGAGIATVLGGYEPKKTGGWMWDLTIPGDHDFYVQAAGANLVHNCGGLIGSLRGAFNEAKRLVNVPRAWLNNRALANSLGGVPHEPNAAVLDLLDLVPGNPQREAKLAAGLARSDENLLNSVFAPSDNQFIATNPSMPDTILQG